MIVIKDVLYISNPDAAALASDMVSLCEILILPAFLIALIYQYVTDMDFKSVLLKLVVALLTFKFFIPMHVRVVDESFKIADSYLHKYTANNSFVESFKKVSESKAKKNGFFFSALYKMTGYTNVIAGMIFNAASYICLSLLKYLYSIVYHLTMILMGLAVVIDFLPISKNTLKGHFKASLWCALMPIVVSFIIVLVGNSDIITFNQGTWEEFSAGIDRFMSLLLMSITLVVSPSITVKIVNGMGLHAATLASGKMAALATLSKGFSVPFLRNKRR